MHQGIRATGILFFVFLYACHTEPTKPASLGWVNFYQSWVHSREEETVDSLDIYRPKGNQEFPESWFRMKYVFVEDNTCQWLVLHPADAHYLESGTWPTSSADKRVVLLYDSTGALQESISFRVISLQEDLLEITSLK